MGDSVRWCEDLSYEDEPMSRNAIQTSIAPPSGRFSPKVPDAAAGESVLAEGAHS